MDQDDPSDDPKPGAAPPDQASADAAARRNVHAGVARQQQSESAEQAGNTPDQPIRLHHERDESPGRQTDASAPDQPMRRSAPDSPGAVRQAAADVRNGQQDTDLYGSGNLASPDDKGRRPDAEVDRADGRDEVRRSRHDTGTA